MLNKFEISTDTNEYEIDLQLDKQCLEILNSLDDDMNDDLNTAKVLAGLFELVPIINSMKDGHIKYGALQYKTMQLMKEKTNK